ncbi:hypothetical protein BDV38DRAFT_239708 [Aspergillus pseudotamarii]|uniref:Uncharacterized protein n=1 Tax=Aspergillus pseudotamarii TaxID=132259 RepID=A0A5N6T2B8_ASPPS|nr:uncharacterized protein BDV38DRAFT_239708 [Aspergillus pseudotamarii]KAE8140438.1 hypothetical protein BDV38DRAFT_239708 [Aspergillus pseudotamarii]
MSGLCVIQICMYDTKVENSSVTCQSWDSIAFAFWSDKSHQPQKNYLGLRSSCDLSGATTSQTFIRFLRSTGN